VRVEPERRPPPEVRLGEALFFTELMAPENSSKGTHSRFSCETCHFEGGVDGRLHYTGRADISVVTKPLFGLANNRPHFSRAMDPDLSSVSHNEFRVAGAGSEQDPWFTLATSRFAWLHELGIARAELSPLELRSALLQFLYVFTPAPNANSQGRGHFSLLEAEGAQAFRQHCQSCHAPRLLSDDATSEAPFAAWESLIFTRNAPLVWARAEYAKTGIVPYVHERGTRITSLRRLALKPRYFTNGSAPELEDVLERFSETSTGVLHGAPPGSPALSAPTRRALVAFLRLL
jgi:cytochrome c peroxidase